MLEDLAKEFAESKIRSMPSVLGVLMVGSASFGHVDALSDVDLEIITAEDLGSKPDDTCYYEQYQGTDFWWEFITFKELEATLKDWKEDIDLWVYSKSRILYDQGDRIRNLLSKHRQYPKRTWIEKLFQYWYVATGNAPYDSGKAIQRGDLLTAHLYLDQAMEYYVALIFLLNHSFVPYRKWRLKEFQKLVWKPKEFEEKLHRVLTTSSWTRKEFEAKQQIINELVVHLKVKLVESGLSDDRIQSPQKFKISYIPRI